MPIRSVMRSVIFATALGLSASSVARADPGCNTTEPPTVELDYAEYRGGRNARGINEFLGIRFAAPPVGDLRWRAPEDPEPVADVQDATQYKAVCVGEGQEVVAGVTEEDCLFLNVFTPADAKPDAKLPVWVFIQGGAWKTDANGNNNGTDLIVNSGYDIVHVNINYRVAQLGFLGGLALGDGGGDYNVGLLDQWKALEWVQKYIHLFGGDPDHVIVHGGSAGAGSISHLLTAYDGADHGLFAGAIGDAFAWHFGGGPNETEPHFAMFSSQMGCSEAADQLACLREIDISKILKFDQSAPPPPGVPMPLPSLWFQPLIDGDFIRGPQLDAFEAGKFMKVPVMVGDATNEGNSLSPNVSALEEVRAMVQMVATGLSEDQVNRVIDAYNDPRPLPMHGPYFSVAADIVGEFGFICPGNLISTEVAKHVSPAKIWNYRWNTTEQSQVDMGLEAWHTSDLTAVFGPGHAGPAPFPIENFGESYLPGGENAGIVPVIQHYYFSFIKHLDPNVERLEGSPIWENWGTETGQRLRIQTNDTAMEDVPSDQVERCGMWWEFNDILQR